MEEGKRKGERRGDGEGRGEADLGRRDEDYRGSEGGYVRWTVLCAEGRVKAARKENKTVGGGEGGRGREKEARVDSF